MGRYPKPDKDRAKLVTLSLPPAQFEYLEKKRKKVGLTRSGLIQRAIELFIERNETNRL